MTSLVRRGFEAVGDGNKPPVVSADLPPWGAFLLATTFAAFLFVVFMIEYTFGRIVPTLVMIESPQESIVFEPLATERSRFYNQQGPRVGRHEATTYHRQLPQHN